MKSDVTYDLLIIGGGISACVFASKYLKNNITKKVGLIEIGRGPVSYTHLTLPTIYSV